MKRLGCNPNLACLDSDLSTRIRPRLTHFRRTTREHLARTSLRTVSLSFKSTRTTTIFVTRSSRNESAASEPRQIRVIRVTVAKLARSPALSRFRLRRPRNANTSISDVVDRYYYHPRCLAQSTFEDHIEFSPLMRGGRNY